MFMSTMTTVLVHPVFYYVTRITLLPSAETALFALSQSVSLDNLNRFKTGKIIVSFFFVSISFTLERLDASSEKMKGRAVIYKDLVVKGRVLCFDSTSM
jgi:hypothetical protein